MDEWNWERKEVTSLTLVLKLMQNLKPCLGRFLRGQHHCPPSVSQVSVIHAKPGHSSIIRSQMDMVLLQIALHAFVPFCSCDNVAKCIKIKIMAKPRFITHVLHN